MDQRSISEILSVLIRRRSELIDARARLRSGEEIRRYTRDLGSSAVERSSL